MKLTDLTSGATAKMIIREAGEDAQTSNPIDREMQNTAQGISDNGSLDPNKIASTDQANTSDPTSGTGMDDAGLSDMGDLGDMGDTPQVDKKPIPAGLMALLKNTAYVQNYNHTDEATSPTTIASMGVDDLKELSDKISWTVDNMELSGTNDSAQRQSALDMLNYVKLVMGYKAKAVKDDPNAKRSGKPPIQNS